MAGKLDTDTSYCDSRQRIQLSGDSRDYIPSQEKNHTVQRHCLEIGVKNPTLIGQRSLHL